MEQLEIPECRKLILKSKEELKRRIENKRIKKVTLRDPISKNMICHNIGEGSRVVAFFIAEKVIYDFGFGTLIKDPLVFTKMLKDNNWGILPSQTVTTSSYILRIITQRRIIDVSKNYVMDQMHPINAVQLETGERAICGKVEFCHPDTATELPRLAKNLGKGYMECNYSDVKDEITQKFDLILDAKNSKMYPNGLSKSLTIKEIKKLLGK